MVAAFQVVAVVFEASANGWTSAMVAEALRGSGVASSSGVVADHDARQTGQIDTLSNHLIVGPNEF